MPHPHSLTPTARLLSVLVLAFCLGATRALAQSITPAADGTGTQVTSPVSQPNQFDISGGTQSGGNLFHSFGQFGLTQGQIANFLGHPGIQNILGRVTDGNASVINGLIQVSGSNANLYLMNPAGIVFGSNASLNVPASFTATTANAIGMGGYWFNATGANNYGLLSSSPNSFAFTSANPGSILNAGNLAVGPGQSIMLLGGTVINTGTISAPGGTVTIAAVPGENLVRITPEGSLLSLVLPTEARSQINPANITPLSLPALLTGGGILEATGIVVENGVVKLTASNTVIPTDSGTAIVSGQISTASLSPTSPTPSISVLGDRVGLFSAHLDASGIKGGGTVLIGGDFQGKGTVPNAQYTFVSQNSTIRADALQSGNGGKVVVWADQTTGFYGNISAKGGAISGDGGSVEVSGKQNLIFRGKVDTSASNGAMGNLLLDPTDLIIANGTADGSDTDGLNTTLTGGQVLAGTTPSTFTVYESELQGMVANTNIVLEATNNITINNLADNTLSFQSNAGGGGGAIQFTADADGDGIGAFTMLDTNDSIVASGRNITISGVSITMGSIFTNTGGAASGGSISLTATQGNLSTRTLAAESSSFTSAQNGGDITVSAVNGSISTRDIRSYSNAINGNSGNGGNVSLTANSTTGTINTNGQTILAYTQSTNGSTGNGGTITLNAGSVSANGLYAYAVRTGTGTDTSGNGGNVTANAANGTAATGYIGSYSSSNSGNTGNGGNVTLSALNGSLTTNSIDAYSQASTDNAANGGTISLTASGNITTNGSLRAYTSTTTGNTGTGGNISLTSTNGTISTQTLNTYSSTTDGNAGSAGSVTATSAGNFTTNNASIQAYSQVSNSGSASNGGNVSITSVNGSVFPNLIRTYSRANTGDTGNAGKIALTANGDITVATSNNLDAYSLTTTGNTGTGGNISFTSTNGTVSTYTTNTYARTTNGNAGNAGDVTVNSAGNFTTNNNLIQADSQASASGTAGNGGNVSLTTTSGTLATNRITTHSQAATGNAGNAGAIALSASGDITTTGSFDAYASTTTGNTGTGGNISVSSSSGNVSARGLNAYAFTNNGTAGSAGNITLSANPTTGTVTTNNNSVQSYSQSLANGGSGDAGNINISGGTVNVGTGVLRAFSNRSGAGTFDTGNGGDITITANNDITTNLIQTYSFQTTAGNTGNAGNVTLTSTNGNITTAGMDVDSNANNTGNAGNGANVTIAATNGNISTSYINGGSNVNNGTAGNGGAISLSASGNISTGYISSRSNANTGNTSNGGAIALTSGGTISTQGLTAYSQTNSGNAGNGGTITLAANPTTGTVTTTSQWIQSYAQSSANGSTGNAGDINISGGTLNLGSASIQAYSQRFGAGTFNTGNGGNVTLNPTTDLALTGGINTYSGQQSGATGNSANGGNVTVTVTNGNLSTNSINTSSFAYTGNSGNAGAINLTASGNITTGSLDLRSRTLTNGNAGLGGNATIQGNDITINSFLSTQSEATTTGNASDGGSISIIGTGNISLPTVRSFSWANNGSAQNAGSVTIAADGTFNTANNSIFGYALSNNNGSTGNGAPINITAASINMGTGVVQSYSARYGAGTFDTGAGADINLTATNGNITTGSINSSTDNVSGNAGNAGDVTLRATNGTATINSTVYTNSQSQSNGNATDAGNLNITANAISTQSVLAFSNRFGAGTGNAGKGGNIDLQSTNGTLSSLDLQSYSYINSGVGDNAGSVNLNATGDITVRSINSEGDRGAGNGGNITIASSNGGIDTSAGRVTAQIRNLVGGAGNGGTIAMTARNNITTNIVDAGSEAGPSGDINIHSTNGNITTNGILYTDTLAGGKGGNIDLRADNGNITSSGAQAHAFINTGTSGNAGNITFNASGTITTNTLSTMTWANTGNAGTAGQIQLNGDGGVAVNGGLSILLPHPTPGVAWSIGEGIRTTPISLSGGNLGNSGDVSITSRNGAIAINTNTIDTRAYGTTSSSGDVTLTAQGNITTRYIQADGVGSNAIGGNITLTSNAGSINTTGGNLDTGWNGTGGNINLTASGDISTATLRPAVYFNANGNAGNVTVTSTNGSINTTVGNIDTRRAGTGSGNGGTINLSANGNVTTGNVWSSSLGSAGNGGNIALNSTTGAISTTAGSMDASSTTGIAGAIALTALTNTTGSVTVGNVTSTGVTGNPLTVTAGGLISQTSGTRINVTGNASFDTTNFANAGTVSVTNSASSGTVFGNSIIGGNFDLTSTGTVSQAAGTALKVAGLGTINTAGNATLSNAEGDFTIGNNVFVRRAGIVDLPTHTISGDMTVTSLDKGLQFNSVYTNNAITLNSANNSFGGTLSLNTAYNGNPITGAPTGITQSGLQTIGGATTLNAQPTGNIALNQNNDFNTVQVIAGQNVSLNDTNAVTLAASTATGNFSLTTGGTLTQAGSLNVTGATGLTASSNDIVSNAAIISGSLTLVGNNITLNAPIAAMTGGVMLTNSGQATISTVADITAAGAFNQNGTGSVSTAGDITAASINFAQLVTLTGPANFSTANGTIQFQSTIAGTQDLTLNAGTGNITLAGAANVGNLVANSTGTTRFDGAVQATSLTTNAGGTTQINGGSITTTGNQIYGDALSLGANTILQGDSVKVGSTVNAGTRSLTIMANEIDFNGAVSGSSNLVLQPLSAAQDITIAGTSNTTPALDLTATELSQLQPGFNSITIGRSDGTGTITLNPVTFQSPVTIAGGSTLVGANQDTTWTITGTDTGTVSGLGSSVSFVSIENLVGGTKNDTFRFNPGGLISGNLNGIGTIDTLDYSAYNAPVTVALGTTTPGTATGVGGTIFSIENVIGSSTGNNTLIGENTRNTWKITNADTGSVNGVTFRNFQNLIGGTESDTFIFSNGARIAGIIDGGPGFDTLNYLAYTTPATVDLLAHMATGTNGVFNIENVLFAIAPPRETTLKPLPHYCLLPKVLLMIEGETITTEALADLKSDLNCHNLREQTDQPLSIAH